MSHTLFYSYTYYWRFYVIGNKHQRNKWESCYADNSWSSNLICDWTYTKLEVKNYGEGVIHVRRNDLAASETDLTLRAKFGWVVIKEKILNQNHKSAILLLLFNGHVLLCFCRRACTEDSCIVSMNLAY